MEVQPSLHGAPPYPTPCHHDLRRCVMKSNQSFAPGEVQGKMLCPCSVLLRLALENRVLALENRVFLLENPSHHFKRAAEESNKSHGQLGRWLGMRKDILQRESGELGSPPSLSSIGGTH